MDIKKAFEILEISESCSLSQAKQAYRDLDNTIKGWIFNRDNPIAINTYGLGDFMSLFVSTGSEKGLFFIIIFASRTRIISLVSAQISTITPLTLSGIMSKIMRGELMSSPEG